MAPLKMTITQTADALGVSRKHVSASVNGRASLSPDMAARLAGMFATEPDIWINYGRMEVGGEQAFANACEAARSAPHLYARCRWACVTSCFANDCLIATHAILGGMPLLHRDRDFGLIAGVEPKLVLVAAGQ